MKNKLESESSESESLTYAQVNRVRTNLLNYVNNDCIQYLKHSKVMLNSEMPKEIIKKYEQFEKKFDNPLVLGSFKLDCKSQSLSSSSRQSDLKQEGGSKNNCNGYNKNYEKCEKYGNLQFAQFLQDKKISCAHKKIKLTSRPKLPSFDQNSQRINKSRDSNFSFYSKLLNEEERNKLKILSGFEKLKSVSASLNSLKFYDKNLKSLNSIGNSAELKKKQYEELFELLEYKGIEFKRSNNEFDSNLLSLKNGNVKRYANSQEKKNRARPLIHHSMKQITFLGEEKVESNLGTRNQSFSSRKVMKGLRPPKNKASNSQARDSRNKSPSTKFSSEFTSKMNSSNVINAYASFDKFVEKYPHFKEGQLKEDSGNLEIDYENYRENLNSSTVQIKEEGDSAITSENGLDSNNSNNNQIIHLKSAEWSTGKDCRSSQSVCTAYDPREFYSNHFKFKEPRGSIAVDNYEDYENLISKLNVCPFNEAQDEAHYLNVATFDSAVGENSFITNSENNSSNSKISFASVSNHSQITRSLSNISKSSGEMDL